MFSFKRRHQWSVRSCAQAMAAAPRFEALESRVLMHGGHGAEVLDDPSGWHNDGFNPPVIAEGESVVVIGPHHGVNGHSTASGKTHYFAETSDSHHFVWADRDLTTPDVIDLYYDFRSLNGYSNLITASQIEQAELAMQKWSQATGGKVTFTRNTTASKDQIINIGTGDMRAMGSSYSSKSGGTLGLGGATYTHNANHSISTGVAWMDKAEKWDSTYANGNPTGTFDYFTVVGQEIGHALGLGHVDDLGGTNIMNGIYKGEVTAYSSHDQAHIQSIYGLAGEVVPPPPPPAPVAGITVSPTSGLTTSEAGASTSFTVVLTTQPSSNVTISVVSSKTTEGTVNVSSLTFTPTNWNTAQSVTVKGVDDTIRDGNIGYTVLLGKASSSDAAYNNLDPADVSVVNQDNEKGGKPSSGSRSKGLGGGTLSQARAARLLHENLGAFTGLLGKKQLARLARILGHRH